MLFPFNSEFHPGIKKTILERAGENVEMSKRVAWMRVSASNGLVLESLPATDSFDLRYGSGERSGRVGTDFGGAAVYADGNDTKFRPSPVIESLSVTFGEGGLTRTSKFIIKCFTLKQAEKVAQYFLEPGYTVLVEFGWNYPKSVAQKVDLNPCEIAYFNKYDYVKKKQQESEFTYDGFMGYITNAGFETTSGETYSISVELTSLGDVAAHLQQHRSGAKISDKTATGGDSFDTRVIDSTSTSSVGLALFMQMYNRLPAAKKNKFVKNLINEKDSREISFISEANFINMDDEIRKDLMNELQDMAVETAPAEGEAAAPQAAVPDSVDFISDKTFIRLELAFEILNRLSYETKSVETSGCPGLGSFPLIIEYRNTICRAHPYMFSIDGSKLMIPNRQTPDFGLVEALSATTEIEPGPKLSMIGAPNKTVDLAQTDTAGNRIQFPEQEGLISSTYEFPIDVTSFDAERGQWGYLKDLYVNFEFFVEVLSKPNYVAKDIYYEILNGISSAANSIWLFEIVTIPSRRKENKDQNQLEIVDLNLSGNISSSTKITKFFSSGIDCAFLESSFGFDLPAAMKNSIITERTANEKVDSAPEGNLPTNAGRLFATKPDPVVEILTKFSNSLITDEAAIDELETDNNTPTADEDPKKVEAEARKQNFELFMKFGTVVPTIKDRNIDRDIAKDAFSDFFKSVVDAIVGFFGGGSGGTETTTAPTLEQIIGVVAWSDASLFRKLDLNSKNATTPNNILLQITFDFKIFGVSGIKTGDLFEIEDLPAQYKGNPFTVVEVSHTLDNNIWTTSVTGKMKTKDGN